MTPDETKALVARLREADMDSPQRIMGSRIFGEAAHALEAQQAEIAQLREALRSAGAALDWAARQMKGRCSGSSVSATMLAAGQTAAAIQLKAEEASWNG